MWLLSTGSKIVSSPHTQRGKFYISSHCFYSMVSNLNKCVGHVLWPHVGFLAVTKWKLHKKFITEDDSCESTLIPTPTPWHTHARPPTCVCQNRWSVPNTATFCVHSVQQAPTEPDPPGIRRERQECPADSCCSQTLYHARPFEHERKRSLQLSVLPINLRQPNLKMLLC